MLCCTVRNRLLRERGDVVVVYLDVVDHLIRRWRQPLSSCQRISHVDMVFPVLYLSELVGLRHRELLPPL